VDWLAGVSKGRRTTGIQRRRKKPEIRKRNLRLPIFSKKYAAKNCPTLPNRGSAIMKLYKKSPTPKARINPVRGAPFKTTKKMIPKATPRITKFKLRRSSRPE
jgi:hypothetical protein